MFVAKVLNVMRTSETKVEEHSPLSVECATIERFQSITRKDLIKYIASVLDIDVSSITVDYDGVLYAPDKTGTYTLAIEVYYAFLVGQEELEDAIQGLCLDNRVNKLFEHV